MRTKAILSLLLYGASAAATAAPATLKIHRGANSFKLESQYKQPVQVWNADGTLSVWYTAYNTPRAKVREDGAGIQTDNDRLTLCYASRRVEPPYELNSATYPVILEFQLGKLSRKSYSIQVLSPCT